MLKKIRLFFKKMKAKEDLDLARFGCKVVMSMYSEEDIKTKGTIGYEQFQKALDDWDTANNNLNVIMNEIKRNNKLSKI